MAGGRRSAAVVWNSSPRQVSDGGEKSTLSHQRQDPKCAISGRDGGVELDWVFCAYISLKGHWWSVEDCAWCNSYKQIQSAPWAWAGGGGCWFWGDCLRPDCGWSMPIVKWWRLCSLLNIYELLGKFCALWGRTGSWVYISESLFVLLVVLLLLSWSRWKSDFVCFLKWLNKGTSNTKTSPPFSTLLSVSTVIQ